MKIFFLRKNPLILENELQIYLAMEDRINSLFLFFLINHGTEGKVYLFSSQNANSPQFLVYTLKLW